MINYSFFPFIFTQLVYGSPDSVTLDRRSPKVILLEGTFKSSETFFKADSLFVPVSALGLLAAPVNRQSASF